MFHGEWQKNVCYQNGDVVKYQNSIWLSLTYNDFNPPRLSSDLWEILVKYE